MRSLAYGLGVAGPKAGRAEKETATPRGHRRNGQGGRDSCQRRAARFVLTRRSVEITPGPRVRIKSSIEAPADDGGADHLSGHLSGRAVPRLALPTTDGTMVDLSGLAGRVVVFAYPRARVARDGIVEKVFHPILPPGRNTALMRGWLGTAPAG